MSVSELQQQLDVVEGYTKTVLVSSESESFAEVEHIKQQIDSFEDDRGKL